MNRKHLKLAPLVFVILLAACGIIEIIENGLDSGPSIVAAIPDEKVAPAVKAKWTHGFIDERGKFATYDDADKNTPEKKKAAVAQLAGDSVVIINRDFVPSHNQNADLWITAIVTMIKRFLHIPIDSAMRAPVQIPDDFEITKEQANELKALIEKGPDK